MRAEKEIDRSAIDNAKRIPTMSDEKFNLFSKKFDNFYGELIDEFSLIENEPSKDIDNTYV